MSDSLWSRPCLAAGSRGRHTIYEQYPYCLRCKALIVGKPRAQRPNENSLANWQTVDPMQAAKDRADYLEAIAEWQNEFRRGLPLRGRTPDEVSVRLRKPHQQSSAAMNALHHDFLLIRKVAAAPSLGIQQPDTPHYRLRRLTRLHRMADVYEIGSPLAPDAEIEYHPPVHWRTIAAVYRRALQDIGDLADLDFPEGAEAIAREALALYSPEDGV